MSEVEYQGIKVKGGKLLLIFPLLGTLAGAVWAGFEGYARWVAMEKKIDAYVAPDLSGFNLELNVLEEKLNSIETTVDTELNAVKELVDVAQDDARTIKTDLKNDMYKMQDSMDQIIDDNSVIYPVVVTSKNYIKKTSVNDKIKIQYTVNLEYANKVRTNS